MRRHSAGYVVNGGKKNKIKNQSRWSWFRSVDSGDPLSPKLEKIGEADPDVSASATSLPALAGRYSKNNNTSLPGSTSTLPADKKPGFLKWLSTGKRKGAGSSSNSVGTLPPKSPRARKDKKGFDEPVVKASSVQHLVADAPEQDDIEPTPALPPAMPSLESKFAENGVKGSSEDLRDPSLHEATDFSREMEDFLCEKFPASSSIKSFQRLSISSAADKPEQNSEVWKKQEAQKTQEPEPQIKEITEEKKQAELQKRQHVVMELLETEKDYVTDLGIIANEFMAETLERKLPEPDNGKERVVFGNIKQIYEWHRDVFSKELEKCHDKPENIGRLFKRYERRLQMYVTYCSNKPLSEFLVHRHKATFFLEIQQKYNRKLNIADYLIKPVQRIMKYQLLIKDILKHTDRAGLDCGVLRDAVDVMHVVPKHANDMMTVARMQGYEGRLTAQGKLLLQETFFVRVEEPGGGFSPAKERKVFLFEQIVIFAELIDKKSEEKGFTYKSSIKCINLVMSEVGHDPSRFKLKESRRNPANDGPEMYELSSENLDTIATWVSQIRELIENQLDFVKALQAPIRYQQNLSPAHSSANSNNSNNKFQFGSGSKSSKAESNLNYQAGGEGEGELPPTPKSVVSSLTDEITNALASRSPDFSEAPSPPRSININSDEKDDKTKRLKPNLTLDLSSHAHCDRVNFSTSPVMTPDGVLKLPPLTTPTSKISGAPATWNLHTGINNNNNNNAAKPPILSAPPSASPRRRLPENGVPKRTPVKPPLMKKPSLDNLKPPPSPREHSSNSSPQQRPRTSSTASVPVLSKTKSTDVQMKDTASVASLDVIGNGSKALKKKKSLKDSKSDEKNMEKRRGRAKHRRLPGFFMKRSKTTEARPEQNSGDFDVKQRKGRRSSSPDLNSINKKMDEADLPKMDLIPKIEALRTIQSSNTSLPESASRVSLDSKHSTKSGLRSKDASISDITSSTSQKESFWTSPMSPAIKPSALEAFKFPNSASDISRQISLENSEPKEEATEKDEKENGIVSMLAACDYSAQKEDEISVKQGEVVQILATNSEGKCLVHRSVSKNCPAAEGWIPGHVLGHTGNTLRRPSKRGSVTSLESPRDAEIATPRSKTKGRRRLRKLSSKTLSAAQSLPSLNDAPETTSIHGNNKEEDNVSLASVPVRKSSVDAGKSPWATLRFRKSSSSRKLSSGKTESTQDVVTNSDVPYFQRQLTSVTVREGDPVELKCQVCGKPRPDVAWKTPNSNMLHGARFVTSFSRSNEATLKISKAQLRDAGQYACIAVNEHGTTSTSATITVQGPPGSVSKPKIIKTSKASITVHWDAPTETGNLPITGYTLEYAQAGSKKWQKIEIPDSDVTSRLIEDLPPGVIYQFRVIAHNSAGDGRPSELSQPAVVQHVKSNESGHDGVSWRNDLEIHYSCTQIIARGRFSVVQELVSNSSGNVFAGKFLSKKTSTKEATEREIAILQSITNTDHFLQIKDTFVTPLAYVIIFPMLSGGRIFDFLIQEKCVKLSVLSNFISQLLEAVSYLHSQDIVHLDIKPENILLRTPASKPEVYLTDFGDAVRLKRGETHTHKVLGSPEFCAPEILRGHPVTPAADIWSIGVVTYSMFSGFSPFFDDSSEEMSSNICKANFSFPEGYFSMVPNLAKEFIKSVLVQLPSTRPSAKTASRHKWFLNSASPSYKDSNFPTTHLSVFTDRRKHQHTSLPISTSGKK